MAAVRGTTTRGLTWPASGCYIGADDGQAGAAAFTGTHGIETAFTPSALSGGLGRRMAIRRTHYSSSSWSSDGSGTMSWGNGTTTKRAMGVDERIAALLLGPGVIPCIVLGSQGPSFPIKAKTWTVNGSGHTAQSSNTATISGLQGMDRIAGGEFDTGLVTLAHTISSIVDGQGNKVPTLVVPWQEMNIPAMNCGYGYQKGSGPWIAAVTHLRAVLDANGATNAILCYCPTQYDPLNIKLNMWPGPTVTEVIMEDLYNVKFDTNVDDLYNLAVAQSVPYGVGESGFEEGTKTQGLNKVQAIQEQQASAKSTKYRANTLIYLIWNQFNGTQDFTYYSSRSAYDAYYQFFTQDAYYSNTRNTAVSPPPPPPSPPPSPPPPPSSVAPTWPNAMQVTGTAQVGKALHANPGAPSGVPTPAVTYQWYRR